MSNNYFIKVVDTEGDVIVFRPEHLVNIVEYQGEDYVTIFLSTGVHYEIPKGQLSLDILVNRCQHAGVRAL